MYIKKQTRVLLGWKNNIYKLCGFKHLLDKKDEPYIKFYFQKTPNAYITNIINNNNVVRFPSGDCNFNEFSYHYLSGIRHLKNMDNHINQKRGLPTIKENSCIHLFSITIHYFKDYQINKSIEEKDFLVPNKFELKNSRYFNFCLFFKTQPKFVIKDDNLTQVGAHVFTLTEDLTLGVSDAIIKNCWCTESAPLTYYHLHIEDNPVFGVVSE